jgi:hypothetical protein
LVFVYIHGKSIACLFQEFKQFVSVRQHDTNCTVCFEEICLVIVTKLKSITNPKSKTMSANIISLDEAKARLCDFQTNILGLSDYPSDVSQTKACLISMDDLNAIMAEKNLAGIRCYLGLRDDSDVGQKVISLIMVGTTLVGGVHVDDTTAIYDLTMPCPNTCDPNSALADPCA